jgi:hypothetical protein
LKSITAADIYAVSIPLIIALIFLEAIFSAHKDLHLYKAADSGGKHGLLTGNILVGLITQGLVLGLYF